MRPRYSDNLEQKLSAGLRLLPGDLLERVSCFVESKQCAQGGFPNRDGEADIYYTAFALRTLALFRDFDPQSLSPTWHWLERLEFRALTTLAELYSYCQCRRLAEKLNCSQSFPAIGQLLSELTKFRTLDHGFASRRGTGITSIYQTFLGLLCQELLEDACDNRDLIIGWLQARQNPDGGYSDTLGSTVSGTNPTAAAIGIWQMLGGPPEDVVEGVGVFLRSVYAPHYGFRAHRRVPLPDLLSTFTGLWTAYSLGTTSFINPENLAKELLRLQAENGGFHAGIWETISSVRSLDYLDPSAVDVEYTFYGLASLAVLQLISANVTEI